MAKEEQASNDTFSVGDLHATLPTPDPWYIPSPPYCPVIPPQNLWHDGLPGPYESEPIPGDPDYPPSMYPEYDDDDIFLMTLDFDPSPPGFIPPSTRYYDLDWNKQSLDLDFSVLEARHFGQIGLHCHNLRMGTNLTFLGARKFSLTGLSTQKVTFVAQDPLLCCTHTFDTHVYWRQHQDTLSVVSATVPPAPDEEDGCPCFSILADTDDSLKDDMPDWLPLDATNNPQFYEMQKSEVEQAKEWLHLYAQLALSSLDWKSCKFGSPIELVKVTVQSTPVVGSKKNMVKADNAIFYMSFKSSDGLGYNGIVRRTRLGRLGELSLRVKCSLM